MNEKLQQKIDELKKGKDSKYFHPLMCFDERKPKTEYEMPADYQKALAQCLEFIENKDMYVRELPNVLPKDIPAVRAGISQMDKAINEIERKLEETYLKHQKTESEAQELHEATWLQEQMSVEHFIMVKHLKPHIFEKFKEYAFEDMTDEEIEEQLEEIAVREAADLEGILCGDIQAEEYENPHIKRLSAHDLMTRELNTVTMLTFHTDDYFKENHQLVENASSERMKSACKLNDAMPVLRRRLDKTIRTLEPLIRKTANYLRLYTDENRKNGKFVEIENPDQEKLDKCFERLEDYRVEIFVVTKHLKPEVFEEFKKMVYEGLTPEEIEELNAKVAECEEKSLEDILQAVADEIH